MNNICKIPNKAKLYYGSGGSDGIIAVTLGINMILENHIYLQPKSLAINNS